MICEGCIKQDVCKYKERVGMSLSLDEPLEITCKYKEIDDWDDGDECPDNPVWGLYPYGCPPQTTWTGEHWPPETCPSCGTTTTCGKEW